MSTVAGAHRRDPYKLGRAPGLAPATREDTEKVDRHLSGLSSDTGSGYSSSATLSCSPAFSRPTLCCDGTAGGPNGAELFDIRNTALETACLLASSFTCGLASVAVTRRKPLWYYPAMAATFVLGCAFIYLEVNEFAGLVARGAGPTRSAFLSAFFTLVGCHGLHVTAGLLWLLTMMAQVYAKGFRADILRRFLCFSLFWHALDIIWVALFTVVYLLGSGA